MAKTAAALAGLVLTLGWAPAASAATAAAQPPTLVVADSTGSEPNQIQLYYPAAVQKYRVGEVFNSPPMLASTGCTVIPGNDVDCDTFQIESIAVFAYGGHDGVTNGINLPVVMAGGDGNDALSGAGQNDTLSGDRGNDQTFGGGGNDTLIDGDSFFGADGNDLFSGGGGSDSMDAGVAANTGAGADTFDGGAGNDTLDYTKRVGQVTITDGDGLANDGESGEGDNVVNAETILLPATDDVVTGGTEANLLDGADGNDTLGGGGGGDQLLGRAADDVLDGGAGPDTFIGGPGSDTATYATRTNPVTVTVGDGPGDGEGGEGDDVQEDVEVVLGGSGGDSLTGSDGAETLSGGQGDDTLSGAGGDDSVAGTEGNDSVNGGSGDDQLDGGAGSDTIDGGSGDDAIEARDGAPDAIRCGSGTDVVGADAIDTVAADCEGTGGPGGGGGTNPETKLDKAKIHGQKATFTFSGTPGTGGAISFECKLGRKPFKPCRSPKSYGHLRPGKHTFKVRAVDQTGATDPSPASKKFTIHD